MKKHYFFKFVLLLIPVSAFVLLSFSGGVGGARTGSPGDGGTSCTICHAPGANFSLTADITTDIPVTGYDVDTDYTITLNATSTAPGHGFLLTAERLSDNGKVGAFVDDNGTTTRSQDSDTRISHANRNNSSWSFTWRSPSTLQGQIRFYASVNAVNNNGSNGGDQVITVSTGAISTLSTRNFEKLSFETFPNPSSDFITLQLEDNTEDAVVSFYDYLGKVALQTNISSEQNKVDVNNLASGVYLIKIVSNNKIGTQKFVKE